MKARTFGLKHVAHYHMLAEEDLDLWFSDFDDEEPCERRHLCPGETQTHLQQVAGGAGSLAVHSSIHPTGYVSKSIATSGNVEEKVSKDTSRHHDRNGSVEGRGLPKSPRDDRGNGSVEDKVSQRSTKCTRQHAMASKKVVVVLGATGQQGSAVVNRLLRSRRWKVRVVVRPLSVAYVRRWGPLVEVGVRTLPSVLFFAWFHMPDSAAYMQLGAGR